jgi:ribose/xylose/arabinose/galactoside ABC-type transport system permease subunit
MTTTAESQTTDGKASQPINADERLAYRGPIQRLLTRPDIGALVGAVSLWVFFWSVSDVFGITAGAANYLDVAAGLGIMAVAVSLLMIGGEFDLSAGSLTGATAMLVILLSKPPGPVGGAGLSLYIAVPLSLLFALGIGYFNATMVEKTGLPSFIVTLGSFFVLIGAKLGFAKLFTQKVIVEGLDEAAGHDFWVRIFGAIWVRNRHILESRDLIYAVLLIVGAVTLMIGVYELSFRRRSPMKASGLVTLLVGVGVAVFGLFRLLATDGVTNNWIYGSVVAAGVLTGMVGLGNWRFELSPERGSLTFDGPTLRFLLIGLAAVAAGSLAAVLLDSDSSDVLGLLLTVQGLRAILFVGLVVFGIGTLFAAARRAGSTSRRSEFAVSVLITAVMVWLAFLIQSESQSPKFRTGMFAALLLIALINFGTALVRVLFVTRRQVDRSADRLGRVLSIAGLLMLFLGLAVRMLFMTQEEVDATRAVINFRVSILAFLAFAVFASWLLANTRFGSWTFAVGGNKLAARSVGVPAARTKRSLFMIVSAAAWLVGMLTAFRLNSVQANVGDGEEFQYIIAAVVGGNLLTGGYGSAAGGAIGAVIMAMSFQGIPFSGWNSDWRFLFLGVILLLAVLANRWVRSKAEASR